MPEEKKAVVGPEHRGVIPHEEAPDAAGETIYIPDYVMQDFGLHVRNAPRRLTGACSSTRRARNLPGARSQGEVAR